MVWDEGALEVRVPRGGRLQLHLDGRAGGGAHHGPRVAGAARPILYHTILYIYYIYYTILYYTILYYTILYYTILYYTILYYTILYYTILYYTILYYTIYIHTIYILYTIIVYHFKGFQRDVRAPRPVEIQIIEAARLDYCTSEKERERLEMQKEAAKQILPLLKDHHLLLVTLLLLNALANEAM